ncbi:MAG TPA: mercuric reductase [Longimicrobiaceae bacterium]|nr:mercuric reductase [Longimicrobiaceae bacterium]
MPERTGAERHEPPPVLPPDEHNRRLVENVHPPDWTNPRAKDRYHLVVVGGGTGGLVTAAIAVALGARVALIERNLLGGDCLNVGCVPSKAVIRAARGWKAAAEAAERFGGPPVAGDGDFGRAMERMRRIRAEISGHDGAARFRDLGVDVFLGDAAFTGAEAVQVDGQTLRFRRAVVAAGSRPAAPAIPGLAEAGYLTNETAFSLTELPRSLAVIGGGPIGCELAQSFARFGSRVTLLEAGERILSKDDADAAAVVAAALVRDGVRIACGARVAWVEGRTIRYSRAGVDEAVAVDRILVATGRTPNVEGLGLEAAGIRFDPAKGIEVDDRLRTSNPRVYAIGDIASPFQFTHVADAHARIVVRNALFFGRGRASELVIPWATYTSPELAHVGILPDEAARRAGEIDTVTVPLDEVDRARLDGETDGFLKVHLEKGSDSILGATLVAEHAGDIISQVAQAMTGGIGLGRLGETIFPYPTQAEVVRKAADQWRRRRLTPLAKSAFETFFRILR